MLLPNCKKMCGQLLIGMTVALVAAPILAALTTQNTTVTILGVDNLGSPSVANGGSATGKVYKDTTTGILYEVVSGVVLNHSKAQKTRFANLGVSVFDPAAALTFTATNDLEVIYRAKNNSGKALAGRVALFVP